MNRIYKVIWSKVKGAYVVTSELAKRCSGKSSKGNKRGIRAKGADLGTANVNSSNILAKIAMLSALLAGGGMAMDQVSASFSVTGTNLVDGKSNVYVSGTSTTAPTTLTTGVVISSNVATGTTTGVVIGSAAGSSTTTGVAIGNSSNASTGTAIGNGATGGTGLAAGTSASTDGGVSLGNYTSSSGFASIALGNYAKALGTGSIAIGGGMEYSASVNYSYLTYDPNSGYSGLVTTASNYKGTYPIAGRDSISLGYATNTYYSISSVVLGSYMMSKGLSNIVVGSGPGNSITSSIYYMGVVDGTHNIAIGASNNILSTGYTLNGTPSSGNNTVSYSGAVSTQILILGDNNTLYSGTSTSSVIGTDNTLGNSSKTGVTSVSVWGTDNKVSADSGATASTLSMLLGSSNKLFGGNTAVMNWGSYNGIGAGSNNLNIWGSNNLVSTTATSTDSTGIHTSWKDASTSTSDLSSKNSTIIGSNNTLAGSNNNVVIFGSGDTVTAGSTKIKLWGNSNTFTLTGALSTDVNILGASNTLAGGNSEITIFGDRNNLGTSVTDANIWGSSNKLNASATDNMVVGNSNTLAASVNDNLIVGDSNTVASGVQNTIAVTNGNTSIAVSNSIYLGTNADVTATAGTTTAGTTSYNSETIGNTTYTYAGAGGSDYGALSIGASGKERRIQNVAAGLISATSTDAVNGSQIYALAQGFKLSGGTVSGATNASYTAGSGLTSGYTYVSPTNTLTLNAGSNIVTDVHFG